MNYNTTDAGFVFDVESLYGHLTKLEDKRDPRGVRYELPLVLLLVILAKLAGEDEARGISQWVKLRKEMLVKALGLKRPQMPHHTTYSRILGGAVDVEAFEAIVGQFFHPRIAKEKRYVVALDGKTLRGTIEPGQTQGTHLLAAYVPEEGVVLMQIEVDSKENEITAAPRIVECLDLRNKVVTGDALLTQRVLSAKIVDAGGDYLWIAKDNQETLRRDIEGLFAPEYSLPGTSPLVTDFRTASSLDKAHGRLERRTITVSSLLASYLDWPHVQQVFKWEREVRYLKSGQSSRQVFYGLTSLPQNEASAQNLLFFKRQHWGIENGLHYRRDVTFNEDSCRLRTGHAARCMAIINNLVIGLLHHLDFDYMPHARRHCAAFPLHALGLIVRTPS